MQYVASFDKIYCYPGTNVLKNKFNLRDQEQLLDREKVFVTAKMIGLEMQDFTNITFDINHLKNIHKTLFQDIYSWAGEFRKVNISKEIPFAQVECMNEELTRIFTELKGENYLKGLDLDCLCQRLAYYKAELNMIHPFREGNGRTLREFTRQLVRANHLEFDFKLLEIDRYMFAMKYSAYSTTEPLEKLFKDVITRSTVISFKKFYGEKYPSLMNLSDDLIMDIQKHGKSLQELNQEYKSLGHSIELGNCVNQSKFNELDHIFTQIKAVNLSSKKNVPLDHSMDLSLS
jgi:cell filamentation protein